MRAITRLAAAILFCLPVYADCPITVTCKIDGEEMRVEQVYNSEGHTSKRYGHDFNGMNGKVHHSVVVQCD
jgi:hypothetical protein